MKICYVTGNKIKISMARKILGELGCEIIQENFETPEIQSLDCEEVSKYSAKYAANRLGIPVIKNDSGFCIDALDGFPGPLAKYAEETIGAEGYIRLLEGKENRNCHWIEVISYCEPNSEPVSFTSITPGFIATEVHEGEGHAYDKIFMPVGDSRTLSEMTFDEHISCFSDDGYKKLYEYLKNKK